MNIFFLSLNPKECAKYHCDKHVVKMILESVQLLYSAWWVLEDRAPSDTPYKLTHKNHPCAVWVRTSIVNYRYLWLLATYLCQEYTTRYGRTHACERHLASLRAAPRSIPFIPMTLPAQAMPIEYKHKNPITAYRTYYIKDKRRFAKWKTQIPAWWPTHTAPQ